MSAGRGRETRHEAAKLNAVNDELETDDSEGQKQGAVGGKEDSEVSDGQETTLSDLAGILHAYMAQQK